MLVCMIQKCNDEKRNRLHSYDESIPSWIPSSRRLVYYFSFLHFVPKRRAWSSLLYANYATNALTFTRTSRRPPLFISNLTDLAIKPTLCSPYGFPILSHVCNVICIDHSALKKKRVCSGTFQHQQDFRLITISLDAHPSEWE